MSVGLGCFCAFV